MEESTPLRLGDLSSLRTNHRDIIPEPLTPLVSEGKVFKKEGKRERSEMKCKHAESHLRCVDLRSAIELRRNGRLDLVLPLAGKSPCGGPLHRSSAHLSSMFYTDPR
ncbi:hypothetical protein AVEN_151980-1 [Araneus ventricosus]|uniref:Uncharacterized protein n=1 Tax=Araneus ventricosus TaxID=182803 RepID=A0A4Y2WI75_ARAVE|nr:hypothetical protein AVEN_151980-1 [Araneus ventricosus]